jgi:hypothetical protein
MVSSICVYLKLVLLQFPFVDCNFRIVCLSLWAMLNYSFFPVLTVSSLSQMESIRLGALHYLKFALSF